MKKKELETRMRIAKSNTAFLILGYLLSGLFLIFLLSKFFSDVGEPLLSFLGILCLFFPVIVFDNFMKLLDKKFIYVWKSNKIYTYGEEPTIKFTQLVKACVFLFGLALVMICLQNIFLY